VRACLIAALVLAFPGVRAADAERERGCSLAASAAAGIAELRAKGLTEEHVAYGITRNGYAADAPRIRALVAEVYRDKLTPAAAAKRVRERCLATPR